LQQTDVSWFTFVALNVDLGGQDVASIRQQAKRRSARLAAPKACGTDLI